MATSGSGVFSFDPRTVWLPQGYVAGSPLPVASSTYSGVSFTDLGVSPGTYVTSYPTSSGGIDTITLNVRSSSVPDGGTSVALFGLSVFGLIGLRKKLPH